MGEPSGTGEIEGLRFRITDLRRHPGSRTDEVRSASLGDLRIGDAEVTPDSAVVTIGLEALSDGIRAEGVVEFGWTAPCRRCVGPADGVAAVDFCEIYVDDPDRYVADADEEVHPIGDGWVDLGEVVRDAALLGLPLAPLCGPDCAGPAPDAFPVDLEGDVPMGESGSEEASSPGATDPRWAALSELRFDPPED